MAALLSAIPAMYLCPFSLCAAEEATRRMLRVKDGWANVGSNAPPGREGEKGDAGEGELVRRPLRGAADLPPITSPRVTNSGPRDFSPPVGLDARDARDTSPAHCARFEGFSIRSEHFIEAADASNGGTPPQPFPRPGQNPRARCPLASSDRG